MTAKAFIYRSSLLHFIRRHRNFSFCSEPWVQLGQRDQGLRVRRLSALNRWG